MYEQPNRVILVQGAAEGDSELTAFDNALRKAGIGDLNLIRVSSIVPPGARLSSLPDIPMGSLTPAAYAKAVSNTPGETIAAAVAAGITPRGGVLMEATGKCSAAELEVEIKAMVEEAMGVRGLEPYDYHVASTDHTVQSIGSAIAAAVLWKDQTVDGRSTAREGGDR